MLIKPTFPSPTDKLITGDELLEMGDIGPSELIEGRIVLKRPATNEHGGCLGNVAFYIGCFVKEHHRGMVGIGGIGIYTRRNPDTVRAADLAFVSNERDAQQKQLSKHEDGFLEVAPELIVEVMSPTDRWSDVKQKLREYFSIGVKLVWVADPTDRTVEAYRSLTDVREFKEADTLIGDDVLPGFSVAVASLFEE
jgi:Uma2 family endonuclease